MKLLLSVGLVFVAPAAMAAITASATVNNLHYELTDLDPNDGIAPSLQLGLAKSPNSELAVSVFSRKTSFTDAADINQDLGSWSVGVVRPGASTQGLLDFNNVNSTMHVSGQVDNAARDQIAFAGTSFPRFGYTLSPKTAVTWSADYELRAFADISNTASNEERGLVLMYGTGTPVVRLDVFANPIFGTNFLEQKGRIEYSFSNENTIARSFDNGLIIIAEGGILPSVPEPQSWLMMLAGFGALGVVARRRRTCAQ